MWRGCQRINGFDLANQSRPAPLTHQWETLISIKGRGLPCPETHTHTRTSWAIWANTECTYLLFPGLWRHFSAGTHARWHFIKQRKRRKRRKGGLKASWFLQYFVFSCKSLCFKQKLILQKKKAKYTSKVSQSGYVVMSVFVKMWQK